MSSRHDKPWFDTKSYESAHWSCPYDRIDFFSICHYWSRDANFEYLIRVSACGALVGWCNVELFIVPCCCSLACTQSLSLWERVEWGRVLTVPILPFLWYYTNSAFDDRPGCKEVWHIAAMQFVTMALVQFLHAAERHVVRLQSYDWQIGQGGCGVLVSLSFWRSPWRKASSLCISCCWFSFWFRPCQFRVLLLSKSQLIVSGGCAPLVSLRIYWRSCSQIGWNRGFFTGEGCERVTWCQ